jgi:hypothetical protein
MRQYPSGLAVRITASSATAKVLRFVLLRGVARL